jgi:hypothetical protein
VGANAIALMLLPMSNNQQAGTAIPLSLTNWTFRIAMGDYLGIQFLNDLPLLGKDVIVCCHVAPPVSFSFEALLKRHF